MKYIIIGLGNYGHVLAEELSALGHEIIGADISESRVDSIKDKVATAFVIDATDEQSLSVLPLNSVDIVVVAIGENFGASVRVVALLKQKRCLVFLPVPLMRCTRQCLNRLVWRRF